MVTGPAFFTAWRGTLPARWCGLVVPYGKALGVFVVGYAGTTALLKPWLLGYWWSLGVPLLAGFGVCWWLWQPWALLARNYKGESRRLPLVLVWLLCIAVGWLLRTGLYYQLGTVYDVTSVAELAQPGRAVFFRLHGPFFPARRLRGYHESFRISADRSGTKRYYSTCYFACPLLPTAVDTIGHQVSAPAWLSYTYQEYLGDDLAPSEREWRRDNFVARCKARFDTLDLTKFTYLQRPEQPNPEAYAAVQASRLPCSASLPLLLEPVQTPFYRRGFTALKWALLTTLGWSVLLVILLLTMDLRPVKWADE